MISFFRVVLNAIRDLFRWACIVGFGIDFNAKKLSIVALNVPLTKTYEHFIKSKTI